MIDTRYLTYDGRQRNHQNGLTFYFTNRGQMLSFLIDVVGDRKRTVRVTMHPDINHARPHVHINEHGASFAVDTGVVLAGNCDNATRKLVEAWIDRHREDLLQLWEIVKRGESCHPVVKRIKRNRSFEDYGFRAKEPRHKTELDDVVIWHDEEILVERNDSGRVLVMGAGDLFVAFPEDYPEDFFEIYSLNGDVHIRRVE